MKKTDFLKKPEICPKLDSDYPRGTTFMEQFKQL